MAFVNNDLFQSQLHVWYKSYLEGSEDIEYDATLRLIKIIMLKSFTFGEETRAMAVFLRAKTEEGASSQGKCEIHHKKFFLPN